MKTLFAHAADGAETLNTWRIRVTIWLHKHSTNWGLAQQLLFLALLTTAVLVAVGAHWIGDEETRHHQHHAESAMQMQIELLTLSSLDALLSRDIAVLQSIMNAVAQSNSHLIALDIVDRNNNRLAGWQRSAPLPSSLQSALTRTLDNPAIRQGESIGTVRATWDIAPIQAQIAEHSRWLMSIIAFLMLALAAILIALTQWIVLRPIRSLQHALQTESAPDDVVGTGSGRELRRLGMAVAYLLQIKQTVMRSEFRYRGLFDHMAAGCMVLSPTGDDFRIDDINAICRQLPVLGIDKRPISHIRDVLAEKEVPAVYAALRQTLKTKQQTHIEDLVLTRGRADYWLDFHIFPLDDGELVLMIRDVTEKKVSMELRQAKEAAEQANELKSTFIASMSHEIRTPLNGVLSMVELLRGTRLGNKQRHWVDAIRGSGQLLLSTINDILDFSRIEAGRLQLEQVQFSLGEVIGNLLNATAQRAYAKGLELVLHQDTELPVHLIGDPFRLQQILVNLVGNAIKFTEHGEVEVSLQKRDLPGNRLLLSVTVRDTGMGIARDQMQQLFQPFERAAGNRFSEGTGLGLTISKRLVEAMAGRIGVDSNPGAGSVFFFEIPFTIAATERQDIWLTPQQWGQTPALVWIPHDSVRTSIVHALNYFGFNTLTVTAAADATTWAEQVGVTSAACLLVLDDSLMGYAGPLLLAQLAGQLGAARLHTLYVVNMFNRDKGELERIELQANTGYVMKPVHASALFNALQELFGNSGRLPVMPTKEDDPSWEALVKRLGAREHLAGAQLLLVEDNLVNQDVAVEALALAGVTVQIAANGAEAVDMVCTGMPFDGVLMDLQMPVMDGFQATQLIRQKYDMARLPIIAMTAGVLYKDRQRSLDVGMNDHVGKPLNMRDLMEKLMKWIKPAHPQPVRAAPPDAENGHAMGNAGMLLAAGGAPTLPGIRVDNGLNRLGGNQKLYFKLLKSFTKAHDQTETELLTALAGQDAKTVRRLAHTLKGVARTVGAEQLHDSAALVEQISESGHLDDTQQAVELLILRLNEVRSSIHILLKSMRPAEPQETGTPALDAIKSVAQTASLYEEIIHLLKTGDTRLQDLCETHQALIRDWFDAAAPFATFMEGIEHYHFEEAGAAFLAHAALAPPPDHQQPLNLQVNRP